jgi:hypothetical protein
MYIAFDFVSNQQWYDIKQALAQWQEKYDIPFQTKTVKNITRVTFASDEMYSFFALTWNPTNPELRNYRVVEPMKLDNS